MLLKQKPARWIGQSVVVVMPEKIEFGLDDVPTFMPRDSMLCVPPEGRTPFFSKDLVGSSSAGGNMQAFGMDVAEIVLTELGVVSACSGPCGGNHMENICFGLSRATGRRRLALKCRLFAPGTEFGDAGVMVVSHDLLRPFLTPGKLTVSILLQNQPMRLN